MVVDEMRSYERVHERRDVVLTAQQFPSLCFRVKVQLFPTVRDRMQDVAKMSRWMMLMEGRSCQVGGEVGDKRAPKGHG